MFADPNNQFNQAVLSANYLYTKYKGMGAITDFTNDQTTLRYGAAQFHVQRRLSHGLQMGVAYTISRGNGMQGWDAYTADPALTVNQGGTPVQGGDAALKARFWGPTSVDRLQNMTINYSYLIPDFTKNVNSVLSACCADWQVSGVTKLLSGTSVSPTCTNTSTRGVAYSMPSYTNTVTSRCNLTGQPINAGVRVDPDPSKPDDLTAQ